MNLKIVVEQGEDGYIVAHCPSLKSCWSQGKTREECLESLAAAIELVLDYRREQGREKAPRGAEQTSVLV